MKTDKLIRFLIIEPHFKQRLAVLIVLLFAIVVLSHTLATKKANIQKLLADKKLVESIPQMVKMIEQGATPQVIQQTKIETKGEIKIFALQGISFFEGQPYAVINDEIYKVGDKVDGHAVYQIKQESVVLKHKFTGAVKEIYLKPFEDASPKQ